MTRQKKELIKKIDAMEMEIAVDRELSHGMAPASAYESMEAEIWRMQDELAQLQHYESYEDKMYHPRFPLSTVRLLDVRTFETYQDMSDGEYHSYLESRKDDMTAAILNHFRTKRKNLYITGSNLDKIAAPFVIPRIGARHQPIDAAEQYVSRLIAELIGEGRLVTADTRHGLGIRTAVKSELAQMDGQQAMGGMGGMSGPG